MVIIAIVSSPHFPLLRPSGRHSIHQPSLSGGGLFLEGGRECPEVGTLEQDLERLIARATGLVGGGGGRVGVEWV